MGSISTGVGLISGMDIEGIVTKLMELERRPITLLQKQSKKLEAEKAAFMTVSAQLLSLKLAATPFKAGVNFRLNSASSSNEDILTAKAASTAVPGNYSFTVRQTAQSHQMISRGFADADRSAVGSGTISFELGNGNLDRDTELAMLRNQQGIRRGQIRITDRSGASAEIDLSRTLTISDVLDEINKTTGISVNAKISGDRIVIEDTSGQTAHNLEIQDINRGYAAADLGIIGSVADSSITGSDLVGVTEDTALKFLNDGNGIRTNGVAADLQFTLHDDTSFGVDLNGATDLNSSLSLMNGGQGVRGGSIKITNKAGGQQIVDLSAAKTVKDVIDTINGSGLNVTASWIDGSRLVMADSSEGEGELKIENVGEGSTATDLGLDGITSKTTRGKDIFRVATLGDVKRVIEDAANRATGEAGKVSVNLSADGKRLEFVDNTVGTHDLVIESVLGSNAAEDLGLAGTYTASTATGSRLVAGLNTVLLKNLNGGSGVDQGVIEIQNRAGLSKTIDLSGAETLQEVLDTINNDPDLNVQARLNDARTGIVIQDMTGATAANFKISDVNSSMASDLGIAVDQASDRVDSGNNQLQYVSRASLLSELRAGEGISAGSFTIFDSLGRKGTISLNSDDTKNMTVGDLIDKINNLNVGIEASINANGDGILLTDTAGGAGTLMVQNVGTSTTASDLNLAGRAENPGAGTIDGSYEYKITIGGSDTLNTLAKKINDLKGPVRASIINDGSGVNAYRLNLTSETSGRVGQIIINNSGMDLGMFDLVEAQDAIVALGSGGNGAIVSSSSTNTFENLVSGLTLNVQKASENPVTISVSRDDDSVVEKMKGFVEKFNAVLGTMKELTKYDAETEQAGVLLGNLNIDTIKTRVLGMVNRSFAESGDLQRLSQMGVKIGSNNTLEFDEEKFRRLLETNNAAVESFFSTKEKGFACVFDEALDDITDGTDGIVTRTTDGYTKRMKLLSGRVTHLEELLSQKEKRLYRQFQNMEASLAKMQTMTSALSSITTIQPISSNSSKS